MAQRGRPKGSKNKPKFGMVPSGTPVVGMYTTALPIIPTETDEQIDKRIRGRFQVVTEMTKDALAGKVRCLIISGPAGMSKSFTVEAIIKAADPDRKKSIICKGFARATGLYKTLYNYKMPRMVTVFDDCDSVFLDQDALNILKAACDTTEDRTIFWGAETTMTTENGEQMPTIFSYEGVIIFLTNYDMEEAIERNVALTPHFQAFMSRAHYIDIGLKSIRDYIIRIKQIVEEDGMLRDLGFEPAEEKEILDFIRANSEPCMKFRELTLRLVKKIADLYRARPTRWKEIAAVTLFKKGMDL